MKIQQFIRQIHSDLVHFQAWIAKNPDKFKEDVPLEEWDELFADWDRNPGEYVDIYDFCPHCKGSFSFVKPKRNKCPFCTKKINGK